MPNILACTRRSRSARETSSRSRRHRAQNAKPTPGSLPSPPASQNPLATSVFFFSAESSARPPGTPDTPFCDSRAGPFLATSTELPPSSALGIIRHSKLLTSPLYLLALPLSV